MPASVRTQILKAELAWAAMVTAVAAHFALVYEWSNHPFLDQRLYASGGAMLPYQARVLMAWLLRYTADRSLITSAAHHAPAQLRDPYTFVLAITAVVSIAITLIATRASIRLLTGHTTYARWAAFFVAAMAYFQLVLPYGLSYTLPYDLPSLAFFAALIALALHERWLWFYPIFAIATLNRETACFVTVFFAVWAWSTIQSSTAQKLKRIAPHVLAQAVIWIAIKLWLHTIFINNPTEGGGTGLFQFTLGKNLHSIVNPGQWPLFASMFAFLWIPLWLGRRWIGNHAIARASAVVIALWIVLMLVVGVVVEVRVFNELAALLAILAALEAWNRWFSAGMERAEGTA